jgi:hypothetical protein
MLSFERNVASIALLSLTSLVACSSSNFDVASSGDSGGGGSDTSNDDSANVGDSNVRDTNEGGTTSDSGSTEGGSGDTVGTDGPSTCPGTVCSTASGPSCVDLNTDPLNCGACNKPVCHPDVCRAGSNACRPGYMSCDSSGCLGCKDVKSDPTACGSCTNVCVTGQECIDGTCVVAATCTSGLTRCPATDPTIAGCYDLQNDPQHCGGCGSACGPDEFCAEGGCVQYRSAPGCTACPCTTCEGKYGTCCVYAKNVVCTDGKCPAG